MLGEPIQNVYWRESILVRSEAEWVTITLSMRDIWQRRNTVTHLCKMVRKTQSALKIPGRIPGRLKGIDRKNRTYSHKALAHQDITGIFFIVHLSYYMYSFNILTLFDMTSASSSLFDYLPFASTFKGDVKFHNPWIQSILDMRSTLIQISAYRSFWYMQLCVFMRK